MVTMKSEDGKGNVVELSNGSDGDVSPGFDDNMPTLHSETRQDQLDMHRLGRKQQLNVSSLSKPDQPQTTY